ncbi:hypothetical protein GCM10010280_56430 [Streptomyces pilosus]|uniref:Uncharacterized protein n=1 Tax=Streptomyces pilosus TaxID=28893 RepID=A0A918C1L0_9ACTN|nr:hypothetical protein GCM10010280_56430 [Streptomyces pilosus]
MAETAALTAGRRWGLKCASVAGAVPGRVRRAGATRRSASTLIGGRPFLVPDALGEMETTANPDSTVLTVTASPQLGARGALARPTHLRGDPAALKCSPG